MTTREHNIEEFEKYAEAVSKMSDNQLINSFRRECTNFGEANALAHWGQRDIYRERANVIHAEIERRLGEAMKNRDEL